MSGGRAAGLLAFLVGLALLAWLLVPAHEPPAPFAGPPAGSTGSTTTPARPVTAQDPSAAARPTTDPTSAAAPTPESPVPAASGPAIVGRVLTPSGDPAPGATIHAYWQEDPRTPPRTTSVRVGADGAYRLTGCTAGKRVSLSAGHPEWAHSDGIQVPAPESGDVEVPPLKLEVGSRVSGIVRDERGRPVAGAIIGMSNQLTWAPGGHVRPERHEAGPRSGADGAFRIGPFRKGRWLFWATDPGRAPGLSAPIDLEPGADHAGLELVMGEGAAIAGRVSLPDGRPLADATVHAWRDVGVFDWVGADARTDADGRFRIVGLVPGRHRVNASKDGFAGTRGRADTGTEDLALTLAPLPPDTEIEVRVRDPRGAPVDVAAISLGSFPLRDRALERLEAGRYLLHLGEQFGAGRVRDTVSLHALVADGRFAPPLDVALPAAGGRVHAEIVIPDGLELRGVVLDPEGRPAAGVRVRYGPEHEDMVPMDMVILGTFQSGWTGVETDAEGRFTLRVTGEGPYVLRARAAGAEPWASPPLPARALAALDTIRLTAPRLRAKVRGRLLDGDGRAVPTTQVLLMESSRRLGNYAGGITDADGGFAVETPLEPGPFRVSLQCSGIHLSDVTEITVPAEPEPVLEIRLPKDLQIVPVRGTVTRGGHPWGGAFVSFSPGFRADFACEAVCDAGGRFAIPALPAGRCLVAISTGSREPAALTREVRIGPDGAPLALDARPATVVGRIVTPEGVSPAPDTWRVTLEPASADRAGATYSSGLDPPWVAVGADGGFRVAGLPAGTYRLLLEAPGFVTRGEGFRVDPDAEVAVSLRAVAAARVRGRLVTATGEPIGGATVRVCERLDGFQDGREYRAGDIGADARFDGGELAAGPIEVTAWIPGRDDPVTFPLDVAPGESIDREFRVP